MPRMIATEIDIISLDEKPLTISGNFRENLRRLMKASGVSQQELADRITQIRGLDPPMQRESITHLLRRSNSPSLDWVEWCSRALGCEVHDLV